jgi:hypothetical protein
VPAPLVTSGDLAGVPAASGLTDRELDMAAEDVRGECDWHIAPVETTTALVSGSGGRRLILPTRRLVDVVSISDAENPDTVHQGWRVLPGPMLYRQVGWPAGDGNIAVTMVHGYERCPADLLAVVLERALYLHDHPTPGVRAETRTTGDVTRARTYSDKQLAWSLAASAVLDRYRVA